MQGQPPLLSTNPPTAFGRRLFWLGLYAAILLGWAGLMQMTA